MHENIGRMGGKVAQIVFGELLERADQGQGSIGLFCVVIGLVLKLSRKMVHDQSRDFGYGGIEDPETDQGRMKTGLGDANGHRYFQIK